MNFRARITKNTVQDTFFESLVHANMLQVQSSGHNRMDITIFTSITILLYFAISGYQFLLINKQDDSKAKNLALFSAIPLLCHGWLLHQAIDTEFGQNLSIFNIFSMTFWLVSILIIFSSIKKKIGILVMAVMPITGLSLLASDIMDHQYIIDASAPGFLIHTLISIAAISVISLAAIQSLFVNTLDNRLKQHPAPMVKGMPALQDMENFLYLLIWTGFILLSLSIITAILFMPSTGAAIPLHKPILSIASWLVFAAFLLGRHLKGWRGKTAVHWTISGFILLFLAYFGTRTVLEFILG